MGRGLAHDVVDVTPGKRLRMRLDGEVDVPLVLRIIAIAATDILHPLDDVHYAVSSGQRVAKLNQAVVFVVDHYSASMSACSFS